VIAAPPMRIASSVCQVVSYEEDAAFFHASAATAAASRTAALPVSVRRNARSGVARCRVHAVRPEYASTSAIAAFSRIAAES